MAAVSVVVVEGTGGYVNSSGYLCGARANILRGVHDLSHPDTLLSATPCSLPSVSVFPKLPPTLSLPPQHTGVNSITSFIKDS
ncbi:hypothetical protein E2C01_016398 [Portunus trituberculatus]|uniref:Uncharacterized protein n=1 Tax=Portunus trituberculatus TaxID=210409 RepID=A0A5B7DQN1_PORTR|nr:hypothetical protein [Portunus trituberculatus]